MRWLETALLETEELNEKEFTKDFKLTETGEIFKGESSKDIPNGRGLCISSKNEMIEAKFKNGKIIRGSAKILYYNGEFYTGMVKDAGVKDGKGVYYYSNGDVYDGEFIDNKRVSLALICRWASPGSGSTTAASTSASSSKMRLTATAFSTTGKAIGS